jgi:hypothetical protein
MAVKTNIKFINSILEDSVTTVISKTAYSGDSDEANFKTKGIVSHKFVYDTTGIADTFDIVALSGTTVDKITFVSIDYKVQSSVAVDENTPKTFSLSVNGNTIGVMSHFEILGSTGTIPGIILVSALEDAVPAVAAVGTIAATAAIKTEMQILIGTKI